MRTIDFLTAQTQLAKTMRQVCKEGAPITIDGMGKDEVVMMSLADFEQLTAELKMMSVQERQPHTKSANNYTTCKHSI